MSRFRMIATPFFLLGSAQAADLPYTSMATFSACDAGIREWAKQFDPISVDTVVIRPEQATSEGKRIELFVQVVYDTQGGPETRQANIECTIDEDGSVAVAELSR